VSVRGDHLEGTCKQVIYIMFSRTRSYASMRALLLHTSYHRVSSFYGARHCIKYGLNLRIVASVIACRRRLWWDGVSIRLSARVLHACQ
jgi:hypothetical protein